jgi:hypothetical protein
LTVLEHLRKKRCTYWNTLVGIGCIRGERNEDLPTALAAVTSPSEGEARMRYVSSALALLAALVLQAPAAHAATLTFGGVLSGANEVPPNNSPGAGTVAVVLDPTAETIQIIASFFGLTTPDVAAHIHCCGPVGTNVGVATTIPAFAGFPLGVTQGTYLSPLFSLEDQSFYNPAFITLEGGLEQAEAALIAGILNQQTYFNIHTTMFTGGEIRTQNLLLGVPEPSTWVMMLLGFAGLGFAFRQSRRKISFA